MKFLLILGIIVYLIYKIGGMFFQAGAASQQFRGRQPDNDRQPVTPKQPKKESKLKGGEYIDYEEIK
jgi:hypothetical protein